MFSKIPKLSYMTGFEIWDKNLYGKKEFSLSSYGFLELRKYKTEN